MLFDVGLVFVWAGPRRGACAVCAKKVLHGARRVCYHVRVLRPILPHGVTVAQLTLDQFVKVRILVGQQT